MNIRRLENRRAAAIEAPETVGSEPSVETPAQAPGTSPDAFEPGAATEPRPPTIEGTPAQNLAQRLGISEDEAADRLRSMATRLGPTGDEVIAQALATGQMTVGLAGISGPLGGARSSEAIEATRTELGRIAGRQVGVVLDNSNGALQARVSSANEAQQETLRRLLDFNREAGITTNVVVHSNGVNALSEALRQSPAARLGQVNLVDVNVSGDRAAATEQLRRVVQASHHTSLVTTAYDAALTASRADAPVHTLIGSAVAAGVHHIRVLEGTEHSLAPVRQQLEEQGPAGELDFRRDPATGATVPVSPRSWANLRYEMRNGRLIYLP